MKELLQERFGKVFYDYHFVLMWRFLFEEKYKFTLDFLAEGCRNCQKKGKTKPFTGYFLPAIFFVDVPLCKTCWKLMSNNQLTLSNDTENFNKALFTSLRNEIISQVVDSMKMQQERRVN